MTVDGCGRSHQSPFWDRFALSNPTLMSAPSKKSFSNVSSPIFACSAFTSMAAAAVFASPLNAFAALAISCSFHYAIWLG
jgi:hypothetical protein